MPRKPPHSMMTLVQFHALHVADAMKFSDRIAIAGPPPPVHRGRWSDSIKTALVETRQAWSDKITIALR